MKSILIWLFLALSVSVHATTYYVSTSGNDATGDGSISKPWASLHKACSVANKSGDIIYVTAGTYTETTQCVLATGVSIRGVDTVSTHIKFTYFSSSASTGAVLLSSTTQNTLGNQSISGIWFDVKDSVSIFIAIVRRSNDSIYNCKFTGSKGGAVFFYGESSGLVQPTAYAQNNVFFNNSLYDCHDRQATWSGNAGGSLGVAGQQTMIIHDNIFNNTGRAQMHNGDVIGAVQGYNKNIKIYNNTLIKPLDEGGSNNFYIEEWYDQGGWEIYNNTFSGGGNAIDVGFGGNKTTYAYSFYIHDNLFTAPTQISTYPTQSQSIASMGIQFEPEATAAGDVIICNNHFKNLGTAVQLTMTHGSVESIRRVYIHNNLCENMGYADAGYGGFVFWIFYTAGSYVDSVFIDNNTIASSSTGHAQAGLYINATTSNITNIYFRNNIVKDIVHYGYVTFAGTVAVSNMWAKNNISYNNNQSNNTYYTAGTPTAQNYVETGNIKSNPILNSSYGLSVGSPAINAGVNVGYGTDIGAFPYNVVNNPPVANAGQDQTITLPTNSLTLSGSGTDSDGSIAGYLWTKISGPTSFSITNPTSSNTTLTSLTQGVYQFQLTVTDNLGATGKDTIQVTVNPAPNQPPVANAGPDQSLNLPANSTTLSGSGTDADGTIASYQWAQISGPSTSVITTPNSAASSVTGLVKGTYQFQLTVTDNNGAKGTDMVIITVSPAQNQPPVANAGSNQTITLPVNSTTLNGSGTDVDGTIVSYLWTQLSGPSSATIGNANSASTSITNLIQGNYILQLKVNDDSGAIATATVQITVNAAANMPPVANAGSNQSITLPTNSATLTGSGTDADGTIVSYVWTKLSGPSTFTIVNSNSTSTDINNLVQGVYQFQLQVTDDKGAVGVASVQVTVNPAANIPPVANAGSNQTITLPVNSVSLTGSGTDVDGSVVAYQWSLISGPSSYTIVNSTSAATNVTGLVQGIYQFQLQVTDNAGATGIAIVQITVNAAANIPPVVNAGIDQTITLPVDSVTLTGSGTDADGTIVNYQWTELSGPSTYTLSNASSAITKVTGLVQGVYQFQLQVTDNSGATNVASVQITVNAAANIPPVANAGSNQSINLPTNSVTLNGSGTDADGTVVSYLWTKISGPSNFTILSPTTASTNVAGLVQGTYQFQLKVTDNLGATGTAIVQVIVNSSTNIPPVANAGSNQTITLPVDSVTLSGSGTDADGTIASYQWTKTSGPSSYTIVNSNSASTDVKGLVAGTYQFRLTVTDNSGATNSSTVKITVKNASNIPPVANAGMNQSITLPTNSVTLAGSGTDADGIVASYKWKKISGPNTYTIVNSNSATTNVTSLVQGVYVFQLTVTDNKGAIGTSSVQITVNAASNIPPVANAGADQTLTLPTNSTTLTGSGTDADGTIVSYQWTEISGPASYSITNPNSATTTLTGLVQGVYQFQLQVTDNAGATATAIVQITVNVAANIPPTASAGSDQVITLPLDSVLLSGSGTDADGTIVSYQWTEISGPASYNIINTNASSTEVKSLVKGVYQFQLQVTDNNGGVGAAVVQITVNAAPNIPPVANAGADQTITLPTNSVNLTGSGTDADGTIVSYQWTEISGPSSSSITNATSSATPVTGLLQGVYEFELQVADDSGAISKDTMMVTVNPAANILPVANAGSDQTITLPVNSVTVNGSGTDSDGTIVSYQWSQISGPAAYTITDPASPSTSITGLVQGIYQFQLQVTDNSGGTATAVVQITVNAAVNIPPVANAGSDQTITLPVNSVNVSGSGTDADGTIASYQWTKLSGPSSFNITNPTSPSSTITGLVQGVYQFELTVTDNSGAIGTATLQIIVNPASNQPPVANAGSDQSTTLPKDSVTLSGSGTDADGSVVSYQWSEISGPTSYTIVNANSATTDINGLVQGTYQFQLKVTDNNGAIGTDIVQVIVNPAPNQPPVANAGADQTITLPTNSVTLTGSGTDADGTITSYQWTLISGPAGNIITSPSSASTNITSLVQGIYKFQLQVTDNNGATANAVVQVTVNKAPNQPPVANAGSDQIITLPTSLVSFAGSGTDADGTIVSYQWTKISGPSSYNIVTPNSANTNVSGLVAGTYQFQLKVTDNDGASATDIIQVIVNPAANQPPVANAGPDQTIFLPADSTSLKGKGTDADGSIVSYKWTKMSGPSSYNIVNANSASTNISGLVQGIYQFQFEVVDNNGAKSDDIITITVNPPSNQPPVANAGADQAITLPINTVTLLGSGSDPDGTVTSYQWTEVSGPSSYSFANSTSASTNVIGLVEGVYLFELRVTDNNGARGRDTVEITVNAAINTPPIANAGSDQTMILPINSASLAGSGTDVGGTIVSYKWTKISGPSQYHITNSSSPVTDAWGLSQGVYQFELTVMDNDGTTGSDTVQITVTPPLNAAPQVYAGPDTTITAPQDTILLSGSATDEYGVIQTYIWRQISGPSGISITTPDVPSTLVQHLTGGTYEFELTVTDDRGAIGKDTMFVIVAEPRLNTGSSTVNQAKIYPNPVTDITTLQINTAHTYQDISVIILDNKGDVVYKNKITPFATNITQQLNLSNLAKGFYTVMIIYSNSEQQSLKLLKL